MSARRWPCCGRRPGTWPEGRGQALVEFSLVIPLFLLMLVGTFDLGRGIFMFNGTAEAAREIARATSTAEGDPLWASQETLDTIATQQVLVPGMAAPDFACFDLYGTAGTCVSGNYVRVTVTATYEPVSFLGMLDPVTLSSTSSVQIP